MSLREGRVEVMRGGEVESTHSVHAVLAWPSGETCYGDPGLTTFWRSSMKPFQALPLVVDGAAEALGLDDEALALCCASHAGLRRHVEGVARVLERVGLGAADLHCGPHRPFDDGAAREVLAGGDDFGPLHNNCSGKHAGMLALARHHGWPVEGYAAPDHPVQRRIRRELEAWLDVDPDGLSWGVDGCGVPTPRLPLRSMARAFARLGRAAASGRPGPAAVVRAMTSHPDLVGGPGRPATRVMEATEGRVVAKEGAEGMICVAAPEAGWGMALKVADGGGRAAVPAAVEILTEEGLLEPGAGDDALASLRRPGITNTRGDRVGELVPRVAGRRTAAPGP